MNYIVNPWLFYLASVSDGIDTAAIIALMIFSALIIATFIGWDGDFFDCEDEKKMQKVFIRKWLIGAVISGVLCIIIPEKADMEKIIMASCLTEENVNSATNYGKDIVDYIFEKVNSEDKD